MGRLAGVGGDWIGRKNWKRKDSENCFSSAPPNLSADSTCPFPSSQYTHTIPEPERTRTESILTTSQPVTFPLVTTASHWWCHFCFPPSSHVLAHSLFSRDPVSDWRYHQSHCKGLDSTTHISAHWWGGAHMFPGVSWQNGKCELGSGQRRSLGKLTPSTRASKQ